MEMGGFAALIPGRYAETAGSVSSWGRGLDSGLPQNRIERVGFAFCSSESRLLLQLLVVFLFRLVQLCLESSWNVCENKGGMEEFILYNTIMTSIFFLFSSNSDGFMLISIYMIASMLITSLSPCYSITNTIYHFQILHRHFIVNMLLN